MDKKNNKSRNYMTNDEYHAELGEILNSIDSNRLLHYLYVLLPKIIKEWH